jgi:C-5 cytosine-specific DNA methylase
MSRQPKIPDHDILLGGFPCQPFSISRVSKKNRLGKARLIVVPTNHLKSRASTLEVPCYASRLLKGYAAPRLDTRRVDRCLQPLLQNPVRAYPLSQSRPNKPSKSSWPNSGSGFVEAGQLRTARSRSEETQHRGRIARRKVRSRNME